MILALRALGWLKANPLIAALALLALYAGYQRHEAHKWHHAADQRLDALKQAEIASKAELARANAERDAAIKHEKELNDATDARVAAARADDARRLDAYLGRLRAAFGDSHRSQVPTAPGAAVAESDQRSGPDPVMVQTLSDDLRICTVNTRRLLEIHEQAVN